MLKKYRIYIQSDHTSRPNNLNNGNKTVSRSQRVLTIGKLIPFTTYYVWVTAINVEDGQELESKFQRPAVFKTNAEGIQNMNNLIVRTALFRVLNYFIV